MIKKVVLYAKTFEEKIISSAICPKCNTAPLYCALCGRFIEPGEPIKCNVDDINRSDKYSLFAHTHKLCKR
jgi:hypothetical protein